MNTDIYWVPARCSALSCVYPTLSHVHYYLRLCVNKIVLLSPFQKWGNWASKWWRTCQCPLLVSAEPEFELGTWTQIWISWLQVQCDIMRTETRGSLPLHCYIVLSWRFSLFLSFSSLTFLISSPSNLTQDSERKRKEGKKLQFSRRNWRNAQSGKKWISLPATMPREEKLSQSKWMHSESESWGWGVGWWDSRVIGVSGTS